MQKDKTLVLVAFLYVLYFCATWLAFFWIFEKTHRVWTLCIAGTTSSLHLLLLCVGAILVYCNHPPYKDYETYPDVFENSEYAYVIVDVLLTVSAVACWIACFYQESDILYFVVTIYGNLMTLVSVAMCMLKTQVLYKRSYQLPPLNILTFNNF